MKKKAVGAAAAGAESTSGRIEPSSDPGLEQPASDPIEEAEPESCGLVEELDPPGPSAEVVEEAAEEAPGASANPAAEVPEAPVPAAVPVVVTEVQAMPGSPAVSGSDTEGTPLASKLDAMAAGASGFSRELAALADAARKSAQEANEQVRRLQVELLKVKEEHAAKVADYERERVAKEADHQKERVDVIKRKFTIASIPNALAFDAGSSGSSYC